MLLTRIQSALLVSSMVGTMLAGIFGASIGTHAATPTPNTSPSPPPTPTPLTAAAHAEFLGTVTLNGSPAPDGTVIEALIGNLVCGTTTTVGDQYDISVKSGRGFGGDFQEGCGVSGPGTYTVTFRSGGLIANERGQFIGHVAQELNLTFGQAAATGQPGGLPGTGSGASLHSDQRVATFIWITAGFGLALALSGLLTRQRKRRGGHSENGVDA